jgi:hypothetical protein
MTLRLVKSGEPEADPEIAARWASVKAAGDKALADGTLEGLFVLLDAGEDTRATVAGSDPMALLWMVRRSAEAAMDDAVFGE